MGVEDHGEETTPTEKTSLLNHSWAATGDGNEQHPRRESRSRSRSRGTHGRKGDLPHRQSRSWSLTRHRSYSGSSLARSTSITRSNTADLASEKDSDGKTPSLWSSSKSQLLVLAGLFIADVLAFMCLAIMAPFFPQEAESKGMSSTVSGWVFGIFSLVQCIFAPFAGKLIPVLGARFLLLSGMFLGGGCTILFGLMNMVPVTEDNNWTFTIFCFVLRIFLALGNTAAFTSIFAIATSTFPDNPSTVLGFLETAIGLGLMLGPALGGVMYEAGGFLTPFAVVGSAMILSVLLFYFILPEDNGSCGKEESGSILTLLKVPVIDLILVSLIVSALLWVGLDPILEPHLRQFNLSPAEVGLVFLLLCGTYAILAPISGRIADRMDNSTPVMIIGFAFLTVGFLLLGPSDLIGLGSYNKLWLTLVSLFLVGVGISLTIVPTYDKILTAAEKAGIPESMGTHGAVAGLWTSVYAFGEFIGPIYCGAAYDAIGFSWTMTIIAIASFSMFFLTILIYLYEKDTCCRLNNKHRSMLEPADNTNTAYSC